MGKATETTLSDLHRVVAEGLTDIIANGQVVGATEGGEPIKASAPASYYAAALKMLADNNITADPETNEELAGLNKALEARNSRRRGTLSKEAIDKAAELLERELGGGMVQ